MGHLIYLGLFLLSFSLTSFAKEAFKAKKFKHPERHLSVIATDDGYYPDKLFAYEGEKVKFFVTSTSSKGHCFILEGHEVFVSAERGHLNEAQVIANQPGRYKFYCPAGGHSGFLTVFAKGDGNQIEEVENKLGRGIASEEAKPVKPSYWLPRDYDE